MMRRSVIYTLLAFLVAFSGYAQAQTPKTKAPAKAAKSGMAKFAKDKKFQAAHPTPAAPPSQPLKGKMDVLKAIDGTIASLYLVGEADYSAPVNTVFLFHEWWGLNNHIKAVADQIHAATGMRVVAIDLYDGKSTTNRDEAGKLMQKLDDKHAKAIIEGAFSRFPTSNIATWGYCMGGGYSLQAAIIGGERVKASVMYYGMPEEDLSRLKMLRAPVLFHFAIKDEWINQEVKKKFEGNMATIGMNLMVEEYAAGHAFANPSNPRYEPKLTQMAFDKSVDFVKQKMQ